MINQITDGMKTFAESVFEKDRYLMNVEYFQYFGNYKEQLGEVDIMGYVDDRLWVVEYKMTERKHTRKKATQQLFKHRKYVVPTGSKYALVIASKDLHFEVIEAGIKPSISYSTQSPRK